MAKSTIGREIVGYKLAMLKEALIVKLSELIDERGWKESEAATFFGVSQSRISDLYRAKSEKFSVDILISWIHMFEKHVDFTVRDSLQEHEEYERSHSPKFCQRLISYLNKVIALNPSDASSFSRRGHLFASLKMYDEAIADYTKCLELKPRKSATLWGRAMAYCDSGQYKAAMLDCDTMLEIDKNDLNAYIQRAKVREQLQQFDLALQDYNRAIVLSPENTKNYWPRALLYELTGKIDQAISDCATVLNIDPSQEWAKEMRDALSKRSL